MATRYSSRSISAKLNARDSGVSITTNVSSSATANEPHSHLFCPLREKMDCLRLRMLNEWNISTIESVRNAIVMP